MILERNTADLHNFKGNAMQCNELNWTEMKWNERKWKKMKVQLAI